MGVQGLKAGCRCGEGGALETYFRVNLYFHVKLLNTFLGTSAWCLTASVSFDMSLLAVSHLVGSPLDSSFEISTLESSSAILVAV